MSVEDIVQGIKDNMGGTGNIDRGVSIQFLNTVDSVLGAILGIIVVVLALGIPLIIALEICYINIPIFRSSLDKITEKVDVLSRPVGLVFRDARKAMKEANTVKTGQSTNAVYLRMKIGTILLAFVMISLCFGPINIVISIVTGLVKSIIQALL